jgi:hypothetical protein
MSLTDEQLLKLWAPEPSRPVMGRNKILEFSRAIESAATAPLLERIAELEQRCQDHHEDVVRFRRHALDEKDARMALERELEAVRKDSERYRWLREYYSPEVQGRYMTDVDRGFYSDGDELDSAIDAAMKD